MGLTLEPIAVDKERELVYQACQGSREAFVALVQIYHKLVRKRIARFIGNSHVVDDLSQDVFLAAFNGLPSYDEKGPFGAWLLNIARNKAISHLRSESRRRELAKQHLESAISHWQADAAESKRMGEAEERQAEKFLEECLNELAPNCRQLIQAHYFDGRTTEAIALDEQKKPGTVRMTLLRIRRSLEKCIRHKSAGKGDRNE